MIKFIKLYKNASLLLPILMVMVLQLNAQKQLELKFIHVVGDSVMQLDNIYQNSFNESFTIRNFKYYISNIMLKDDKGNMHKISNGYFLVDEKDSLSKKITFKHTVAHITAIRFLLGVDSIKNVSGVQTGALDPLKGMFWTWNNGYIMAKLEGKSPASKSLGNYFTYHIGGYKQNENAARWIELPVEFSDAHPQEIDIKADAGKWFNGKHEITIASQPVCHEQGALAMLIADNYETMFSIIKNQ